MTSCLRSLINSGRSISTLINSNNGYLSNVACSQILKNVTASLDQQQKRGNTGRWMRRDRESRLLVCATAPERRILEGIQVADGVLPEDLRHQAKKDLRDFTKWPRRAMPELLVNRCVVTGRTRGIVRPWRLSRFQFRDQADHGKLCGVKRAMWGVNHMKARKVLL